MKYTTDGIGRYIRDRKEYDAQMEDYYRYKEEWESMTPQEQMKYNQIAETASIKRCYNSCWIIITIFIGIIGVFYSNTVSVPENSGDTLKMALRQAGLLMTIPFSIGIILSWPSISKFIGRGVRGFCYGCLLAIGMSIVGWIGTWLFGLRWVNGSDDTYQSSGNHTILVIVGIFGTIGFIIGIINEISGRNHASGAPVMPKKPSLREYKEITSKDIFH